MIKEVHENEWREKVMSNLNLKIYTIVHEKLETIFWWHLARDYPNCLGEITDVLGIMFYAACMPREVEERSILKISMQNVKHATWLAANS